MITTVDRIRIGIMGCSELAGRRFLPALRKTGTAVLAAIANRDQAVLQRFFPDAGCPAMSYEELLAAPDVDLVYISLPNYLHERWVLRALENGKHVISEKPLGLSAESVARMAAAADQRGLLLYGNMAHPFHPQHAAVKAIVESGRIGRIKVLRAGYGYSPGRLAKIGAHPEAGKSVFLDVIRHPLSIASLFLDPELITSTGYSISRGAMLAGIHGNTLTKKSEVFEYSVSFTQEYESFYELVGERGNIRVDMAYHPPATLQNIIRVTQNRRHASMPVPPADQFGLMVDSLCSAIVLGQDLSAHGKAAIRLAAAAEQVKAGCRDVQDADWWQDDKKS